MRMALSGSRTEFLAADKLGAAGDIQYGRSGGCFVTTRRGVLAAALALAALVLVGLLVYYLAPCPNGGKQAARAVNGSAEQGKGAPEQGGATTVRTERSSTTTETAPPKPQALDLRLPAAVRPSYYSIWLQPFIGDPAAYNFTYKGLVDVEVRCEGAGDACARISVHAKDLNVSREAVVLRSLPPGVSSVNARGRAGSSLAPAANASAAAALDTIRITGHSMDTEKDLLTFTLEKPMQVGRNYSLELPFWGNLSTGLSGFYRSSYTETNGRKRWLAVTHFEPTYARRAFPCFDEPAMKARFEMHVARRDGYSSLFNMPLSRTESIVEQPGWVWDHYPASPVMSTYLVALVVSEMAQKSGAPTPGAPAFEVVARPELLPTADYALDIGPRVLRHFVDYFNISYPLPKLTMAAVPDFAAGAMENWGLVLYRENLMLYNPNITTTESKKFLAIVVAHELAHQWFGNLVTMAWWSDLWLNEGFATYISYIGVHYIEPKWNMLDNIVIEQMHPVLETDSLNSSHPVSVEVQNPSQISEVFDEVSYNKGACLIRMLNHSLTETVFRSGLTNYLNKWKWTNANQDDLWAALTAAAGNASGLLPVGGSVKEVMDTWTLQMGYPVVMVKRDYTAGSLHLSQRQFKLEGTNGAVASEERARAWYVPVSYASGDEAARVQQTQPRAWLTPEHRDGLTLANVTAPGSNTWLLINIQQTGYYRVNYDNANWRLLSDLLKSAPVETVPAASRAQLLSDALNLARAGLLNYDTALNFTKYLTRELAVVPWLAFLRDYSFLDEMMRDSPEYQHLQAYVRELLGPVAQSVGREGRADDELPQRQLRSAVLARQLRAEDPQMLDWARDLFALWLNSSAANNPVPVDMRFEVYCAAAQFGGAREWAALDARFRTSDQLPNERQNLLRALMCTRLPHLIATLLERSLDEGGDIRLQDSLWVWRSISRNPVASYVAFRYVRQHWDSIYERYSKVSFIIKEVLRSSIGGLSTEYDLEDVMVFYKAHEHQFSTVARTVQQSLERLRLRVHWRSRHSAQLAAWLRQEAATGATTPGNATTSTPASPTATSTPASTSTSSSSTNTTN